MVPVNFATSFKKNVILEKPRKEKENERKKKKRVVVGLWGWFMAKLMAGHLQPPFFFFFLAFFFFFFNWYSKVNWCWLNDNYVDKLLAITWSSAYKSLFTVKKPNSRCSRPKVPIRLMPYYVNNQKPEKKMTLWIITTPSRQTKLSLLKLPIEII